MDVYTPEQRSAIMSRIKGKNTKPELVVRRWLWEQGFRYRKHGKGIPGRPDIVFPGKKKAIFIHGCFWHHHDCKHFRLPKSNVEYWQNKIERNVLRDKKNQELLREEGWQVITLWECEIKEKWVSLSDQLLFFLSGYYKPATGTESSVAETNLSHGQYDAEDVKKEQ